VAAFEFFIVLYNDTRISSSFKKIYKVRLELCIDTFVSTIERDIMWIVSMVLKVLPKIKRVDRMCVDMFVSFKMQWFGASCNNTHREFFVGILLEKLFTIGAVVYFIEEKNGFTLWIASGLESQEMQKLIEVLKILTDDIFIKAIIESLRALRVEMLLTRLEQVRLPASSRPIQVNNTCISRKRGDNLLHISFSVEHSEYYQMIKKKTIS